MTRWTFFLVLACAAGGCSDQVDVIAARPVDGGSGGGGAGAGGTEPIDKPLAIDEVTAPDEYSVLVVFNEVPPQGALSHASYRVEAPQGSLELLGAEVQADGRSVLLSTSRQKLGITYELILASGDAELDALGVQPFLAADTARFWATDFGSPTFAEYELVAERRAVGTHGVIYVEQGMDAGGIDEARDFFDSTIFPVETDLFIAAPDMDGNERIVLLGLDGASHYGGYFSPINALTDEEAMQMWNRHSNEMEMVYINVAPGWFDAEVVLAHEFEHLLYHERHGLDPAGFAYHNEGLAECAVNAVNGHHPWALGVVVSDPEGQIAAGLSLLDWQYGNYNQYVLSYVFWSWIAGQLGGVSGYGQLFDQNGHPSEIEELLQAELGIDFATAQLDALLASWVQAPSGIHSFNGLLSWPGKPPRWLSGPLSLSPFAGTWVLPPGPVVDYPGNQGAHIVYAGIDGAGSVDLTAPFDVDGGALVILNTHFELDLFTPEPTGLLIPPAPASNTARDLAWRHPPPVHPAHFEALRRWRARTAP